MDNRVQISELAESILKALLYYDLFDYPLTPEEIFKNLPTNHVTPGDVRRELDALVKRTLVFQLGNFFSIQSNLSLESRRLQANQVAHDHLKIAARKARLISRFPFVRSVMVSGSLSKGYADEKSDIDFFVITEPRRLWITRTLLACYRRLAYFNSRKYFCINYFIDKDHLHIEEKNLFTATELTTLVPLAGLIAHRELMEANAWVRNFFPNYQQPTVGVEEKLPRHKWVSEWFINQCFPEGLDKLCMTLALRRWKKIHGGALGKAEFQLAFKTSRSVSKSHPLAYQNKIISRYDERVRSFIQPLRS